jgi:hypothetical protein
VLSTTNFEKKLEKLPSRAFLYYNQIQTPIWELYTKRSRTTRSVSL